MIYIGKSIDYFDVQVSRQKENFLKLGEDQGVLFFDGDCLPYLVKQKIGVEFKLRYSTHKYSLYSAVDETIFLQISSLNSSIQFKGIFFLQTDWKEKMGQIIDLLNEQGWPYHLTRTDLGLTVRYEKK